MAKSQRIGLNRKQALPESVECLDIVMARLWAASKMVSIRFDVQSHVGYVPAGSFLSAPAA